MMDAVDRNGARLAWVTVFICLKRTSLFRRASTCYLAMKRFVWWFPDEWAKLHHWHVRWATKGRVIHRNTCICLDDHFQGSLCSWSSPEVSQKAVQSLNNRLYRVNKHPTGCQTACQTGLTTGCIHDTTGCQTGLTTALTTGCIVYTNIYQVVKPVWPVWQQVVLC